MERAAGDSIQEKETDMKNIISKKMSTIGLSGIRKMNEKALAMERAGQTVIHFEIGRLQPR